MARLVGNCPQALQVRLLGSQNVEALTQTASNQLRLHLFVQPCCCQWPGPPQVSRGQSCAALQVIPRGHGQGPGRIWAHLYGLGVPPNEGSEPPEMLPVLAMPPPAIPLHVLTTLCTAQTGPTTTIPRIPCPPTSGWRQPMGVVTGSREGGRRGDAGYFPHLRLLLQFVWWWLHLVCGSRQAALDPEL